MLIARCGTLPTAELFQLTSISSAESKEIGERNREVKSAAVRSQWLRNISKNKWTELHAKGLGKFDIPNHAIDNWHSV
jgi:hypothetical protein